MPNLDKFVIEGNITQDEKELFELILYHRKHYEATKNRQGGLHPDDIEIMKILDQGNQLLVAILEERKNRVLAKQTPTRTNCPQCDIEKERIPIWEEKNEHGYMCSKYKCDECKIEFLDETPNNAKDQLSWLEGIIAVVEKHKDDLSKDPEQVENIAQLKKQREKFIKACEVEEEAFKNLQQAEQIRDKAIAEWRDYLLTAKIKQQWGNPPASIN